MVEFIKKCASCSETFKRRKEEFKRSSVSVKARFVFHGIDVATIGKSIAKGFKLEELRE